jgi:hypothetical protein
MANESYIQNGTVLSVNGEAGADYAFSVEGLADGAGRVSAQIDLGAVPRPMIVDWSAECQWQATPTQGGRLDLYISTAPDVDSTMIDGDVGASDAALSDVDSKRNLKWIGAIVSENATASEVCAASSAFTTLKRYLSIVAINGAGATINATDSNFQLKLTPKYMQGQ